MLVIWKFNSISEVYMALGLLRIFTFAFLHQHLYIIFLQDTCKHFVIFPIGVTLFFNKVQYVISLLASLILSHFV